VTGSGRPTEHDADDAAQLAALGYSGEFERSMGLWANMALGFTESPTSGSLTVHGHEEQVPACLVVSAAGFGVARGRLSISSGCGPEGTNQVTGDTVIGAIDRPGHAAPAGAGAKSCVQTQRPSWQPVRTAAANLSVDPERGDRPQACPFSDGSMTYLSP
jgi:hypothetical protein